MQKGNEKSGASIERKKIGQGCFGTVYLQVNAHGEQVAVKVVPTTVFKGNIEKIKAEYNIQRQMDSEYIVK